VLKVLKVDKVL
jgi:hypothetical protein